MSCKTIILLTFTLSVPLINFAQNDTINDNNIIEKIGEDYAEKTNQIIDYTSFAEGLDDIREHPVDLNKASPEDLKKIPFLTDIQINNLLNHIDKNGKLLSLYELQSIEGFDDETIQKILPYVKINTDDNIRKLRFSDIFHNSKNQLYFKYQEVLQKQKGYQSDDNTGTSSYPGSPAKLYTRYRMTIPNKLSLGITAEKDPGEEFFNGSQKNGFDFYSAHLFIKNSGFIKELAIGDYSAQFGQGLTLWNGFLYGSSSGIAFIKKNAGGLKPFTSCDENNFMRGIASTLKFSNVEATFFYSNHKIDANAFTDTTGAISFSSLQESGIHATQSQLKNKDAVGEEIAGSHLAWVSSKLTIGITGYRTLFDGNFQKTEKPYNFFEFSGNLNYNAGFDYNYIYRNMNFFGESSVSKSYGKATINGLLICPDRNLSFMILNRYYEVNYQSLYNNAFSQNTKNANESGTIMAVEFNPVAKCFYYGSYDVFRFPWLRYNIDAPSKGYEANSQLTIKPDKKTEMYIKWKRMSKQLNNSENPSHHTLIDCTRDSYRFHISYPASEYFTFRDRVELSIYNTNDTKSKGYLIYHEIIFKKFRSPLSFSFRYSLFSTDDYNSRIYSYESDLLYNYSIPFAYYSGMSCYFNVKYKISKGISAWIRLSNVHYTNRSTIGSGPEQIDGNNKTILKAQVRIEF
ncbi:MAG: helix-hairpin-helix domain-containing protein [Bacteroidota bacterium]|nr:helix-hairpin-helix domain-containing protein [Bacteroidota bacterium]